MNDQDTATTTTATKRKAKKPKRPFTQGDVVAGKVTGFGPDAVARGVIGGVEGVKVVGGVPGDAGTFRLVHVGKNQAIARPEDLETVSEDRVMPRCEVVDTCGGCPWQMVSVQAQRRERAARREQALGPMLEGATQLPLVTSQPYGHRTRATMIARHRAGTLRLGFYAPRSSQLVPAEDCPIQDPIINEVMAFVGDVCHAERLPTWRNAERPGLLRAVRYVLEPELGAGILTLVLTRKPGSDSPTIDRVARMLMGHSGISGVATAIAPPGGSVNGTLDRQLVGARRQGMAVGDERVLFGPTAFVQTNAAVGAQLVAQVVSWLKAAVPPAASDADAAPTLAHLVDLYAGVGVMGLAARHLADKVTLIERHHQAAIDARANASRLPNAAHVQVVETAAADALGRLSDADAIVVDPPRAGCGSEVVAALASSSARVLVYVSCNVRSLARDAAVLQAAGWTIQEVAPFEMFVHTHHQEVAVLLTRPG